MDWVQVYCPDSTLSGRWCVVKLGGVLNRLNSEENKTFPPALAAFRRSIQTSSELSLRGAGPVNDLRSRGKQLSAAEHIFITATMQFRADIKSMYSLSKPHIGYKGLMRGYQNKVISLAGEKAKRRSAAGGQSVPVCAGRIHQRGKSKEKRLNLPSP
ncbi:hypothetical protein SRHO_G00174960 [Serrasalmus rhombeus]